MRAIIAAIMIAAASVSLTAAGQAASAAPEHGDGLTAAHQGTAHQGTARGGTAQRGTAAHQAAPAAKIPTRPVTYDCAGWHDGQTKVSRLELSCDGNVLVLIAGWRYWSAISARSSAATLWVNTCRPDCAAGHYRRYPGTVVLYRARSRAGTRYYSRLLLQYRHGRLRRYVYRWARYPGASQPVWVGGP